MAGVRQFDEAKAVERSLEVFWKKGLAATSMQDLAEATGVLRGSLYNAYGGKEPLFLAAYAHYRDLVLQEAREALAKPTPEKALRAFFDFTIGSMTQGTPARGCLTTKTATDERVVSETVQAALREFLESLEALVHERLARPDAAERLAVAPSEAARLVVTLSRGIVVMERIHHDAGRLKKTADALVRALLPPARP
jgi:AcrR family transcriptional regulator